MNQARIARKRAAGASPAGVPVLRWRRVFPGEEAQLGPLRRWLELLLPACPARDDVVSVAGELCTNAVAHTASGKGGWFVVEVAWSPAVVRVAVADGGAPTGPRTIDDPQGEHGRGLLMVDALAVRTGVSGDARGRVMWADIPWAGEGAEDPAGFPDGYESSIRDAEDDLARRYPDMLTWFGRQTLQWWGLPRRSGAGGWVAGSSPQELAQLLDAMRASWRFTVAAWARRTPHRNRGRVSPVRQLPGSIRRSGIVSRSGR